jgi:hypothetical protein
MPADCADYLRHLRAIAVKHRFHTGYNFLKKPASSAKSAGTYAERLKTFLASKHKKRGNFYTCLQIKPMNASHSSTEADGMIILVYTL